ncbi:MAG: hypothetical protein ACREU7_03530 [Burkholderiales bacterium]
MSKLAERIRKAGRTEQSPLGFARAARVPSATLLTIVQVNANESSKAAEALEKGADAVILDGADSGKVKDAAKKAPAVLLGAVPKKAERDEIAALRDAGADFIVLDPQSTPAAALLEEKIGLVATIDSESDDTTLRLYGELELDALIVAPPDEPLTVQRLLRLRRFAALTRTPLFTEAAADSDASHLQALRDSGIVAVLVPASALGKLNKLREVILSLPARGGRKREEARDALLPTQALAGSSDGYDDEDDD